MKYAAAVLASLLIGASAVAVAKSPDGDKSHDAMKAKRAEKMEKHFKEVDANADGKVTEEELLTFITAKAKADFAAMAGDDGAVTFDEYKAHHHAKHKEMMKEHHGKDKAEEHEGH